jgi:hypothetical protein
MKNENTSKEIATKQKYEIVLARYSEQMKWLKYIPKKENRNYSIYLSNSGEETQALQVDREVFVENIGREAGHYLQYIISNYENLSDVIVFLQAEPWWHFAQNIESPMELFWGNPRFDFPVCYIGQRYNELGLPIDKHSTKEAIFKSAWKDDEIPKSIKMAIGAQFYVKKEIILKRPVSHYQTILDCHNWEGVSLAHILEPHWASVFDHNSK